MKAESGTAATGGSEPPFPAVCCSSFGCSMDTKAREGSKPTSTVELASAPTQLNLQGPSLAKTPFCSPVPVCVFLLSKGPPPQMGKVLGPTHSGSLPVATRVQHTACSIDASVGFLSSEHPPSQSSVSSAKLDYRVPAVSGCNLEREPETIWRQSKWAAARCA